MAPPNQKLDALFNAQISQSVQVRVSICYKWELVKVEIGSNAMPTQSCSSNAINTGTYRTAQLQHVHKLLNAAFNGILGSYRVAGARRKIQKGERTQYTALSVSGARSARHNAFNSLTHGGRERGGSWNLNLYQLAFAVLFLTLITLQIFLQHQLIMLENLL